MMLLERMRELSVDIVSWLADWLAVINKVQVHYTINLSIDDLSVITRLTSYHISTEITIVPGQQKRNYNWLTRRHVRSQEISQFLILLYLGDKNRQ